MGKKSRTKGRAFEQLIARRLREVLSNRTIRRGRQTHQADEPDVVIEDVPLWMELQHADKPQPIEKLHQAVRDIDEHCQGGLRSGTVPVAITRRTRLKRVNVTMYLRDIIDNFGEIVDSDDGTSRNDAFWSSNASMTIVSFDFEDWLRAVKRKWGP